MLNEIMEEQMFFEKIKEMMQDNYKAFVRALVGVELGATKANLREVVAESLFDEWKRADCAYLINEWFYDRDELNEY
ncbi:MAG: hypothetical protein LBN08_04005 [Lactobacillales bacterium]|jgi:hypothetical protein|nr:hypothetical protein [Lactobacillales bacterium]